jgi:hypothetical protein
MKSLQNNQKLKDSSRKEGGLWETDHDSNVEVNMDTRGALACYRLCRAAHSAARSAEH